MRVEVMEYYGLTQPFSQAGYYETQQHTQLLKDIKGAILEGRLIAVCGVVGSGKTVTMRRLQQQLKEENPHYGLQILVGGKAQYQAGNTDYCAVLRSRYR
jgi:type II secretory pathway predicted ATPase ExeA